MKKILIVGMLDSIHLARWLSQFNGQDFEITVFPSSRFRRIHPQLKTQIQNDEVQLYSNMLKRFLCLAGYLDFIRFELLANALRTKLRSKTLQKYLTKGQLDILHLIELQHAGYLYLETEIAEQRKFKIILTNYGSDLLFFKSNTEHRSKLEQLLIQSDFYSAECRRDYCLAREIGFKGIELPLIPNAGGFSDGTLNHAISPLRERRIVYVKGHGGRFGLGEISLRVADRLLCEFSQIEVVVVSLSEDLRIVAKKLQQRHRGRIKFYSLRNPIAHENVLSLLRQSVIYIGASQSDGISTTFLEALISGAIPIQTNTSCASEWLERGFFAIVVPPLENIILEFARQILLRVEEYESQAIANNSLAKHTLSGKHISSVAQTYYK